MTSKDKVAVKDDWDQISQTLREVRSDLQDVSQGFREVRWALSQHRTSIPNHVQRHIATFLVHGTSVSGDDLSNSIMAILSPEQRYSFTIKIPPVPFGSPVLKPATHKLQKPDRLNKLPLELVHMIRDRMQPADAVCLSLTCRKLTIELDCHANDLDPAKASYPLSREQEVHDSVKQQVLNLLNVQRLQVQKNLERDRVQKLIDAESSPSPRRGGLLACSACIALHPKLHFSDAELAKAEKDKQTRICLAAEARIRFCDHWSENIHSLRAFCRGEGSSWKDRQERRCCAVKGKCKSQPEICLEFSPFGLYINRTYTILSGVWRHAVPDTLFFRALQSRKVKRVCSHISIGDPIVLDAYHKEPNPGSVFTGPRQECKVCNTNFRFRIKTSWIGGERSFEKSLVLEVSEKFGSTSDCWTDQYLEHVEDGGDLIGLRDLLA